MILGGFRYASILSLMLLVLGQENLTSGTSPALTAACTSSHIQSWQESISNPSRDDTGTESFVCVNRDFPYGLRPTTVVGSSDESITDREIGKRVLCSAEEVCGCWWAIAPPEASGRWPFAVDPHKRALSSLHPPAVSSFRIEFVSAEGTGTFKSSRPSPLS